MVATTMALSVVAPIWSVMVTTLFGSALALLPGRGGLL